MGWRRRTLFSDPSPSPEPRREQADARRESVERYNEVTFGERRPIAGLFLRGAVFVGFAVVLVWLLRHSWWR
jgi:hypothetical protein